MGTHKMDMTFTINLDPKHFPLELRVKWIDGKLWETLSPYEYIRDNGEVIHVPAGFPTDFGSKPSWCWWLVGSPTDEGGAAYIPHDYLCKYATWPRSKTDQIFLEALRDCGVAYLKRYAMFVAVRIWSFF